MKKGSKPRLNKNNFKYFLSFNTGHLKSMDLNRNKTHGSPYNIAYRPSSAITHTSIASMEEKDEKFNPQRPSHLGMF